MIATVGVSAVPPAEPAFAVVTKAVVLFAVSVRLRAPVMSTPSGMIAVAREETMLRATDAPMPTPELPPVVLPEGKACAVMLLLFCAVITTSPPLITNVVPVFSCARLSLSTMLRPSEPARPRLVPPPPDEPLAA